MNEFRITIPPLRDRHGDLLPLVRRFVVEASMELERSVPEISDEAAATLLKHSWPSNVRELKSVVRRAVLLSGDAIGPDHLDLQVGGIAGPPASDDVLPPSLPTLKGARHRGAAEAERKAIRWALEIAVPSAPGAAAASLTYQWMNMRPKRR